MPEAFAAAASPRVTVIIATYNWSTVLPYSIGSVLQQSFTDFEVLVVGDGCTDDSEQVVTAITDPRVRWINLPVNNGHQYAPNNEGLAQARGSIIAYLGHDDLWLPHHLELMVAAIEAGNDVVHSIVHMIGADGNVLPPAGQLRRFVPGEWIPPTGVAHRRNITQTIGGWQDYRNLSGDPESDLWRRMHLAGFKFQYVNRLTAVKFPASLRRDSYRKRSNQEQQRWTDRILREKDLEAVELAKIVAELHEGRTLTFRSVFRSLPGQIKTAMHRLPWGLTRPLARGANVRARRRFKGL